MRRYRQQAKAAKNRRHFPPGKKKVENPAAEKGEELQLIGRSQEICRGKRFIITIRGDPKTFEKLRKDKD